MTNPLPILNCFTQFCNIKSSHDGSSNLNLIMHRFFYPTTLIPLMNYMVEKSVKATVSPQVHGYVSAVLPSFLSNKAYVPAKSYVPLRRLTKDNPEIMHKTTEEIIDLADTSYGGEDAISYLLTELGNNLEEHSEFENAFIMAQKYPKLNFTEVCMIDDGIGIPCSFKENGIEFKNDYEAIFNAMNGVSTKEEQNGRGWGINTIVQIFTEGLHGEIFIASREGAVYINKDKIEKYITSGIYHLKGTLVSLRIPQEYIEITNYLERKNIVRDRDAERDV